MILNRVPGLLSWASFGLACVLLLQAGAPASLPPGRPADVRFHHVHYRVADPGVAMNALATREGGIRVIASGLGAGVRVGRVYALFDRFDATDPESLVQAPIGEAYADAVRWLASRGLAVDSTTVPEPAIVTDARYHHFAFVADDPGAVDVRLTGAGATALRRTEDAVLFEAGRHLRVEIVRDVDREDAFWCPMHPDVRSPDAGTCPACGMSLVPIPPPRIGEYNLEVTQIRGRSQAVTGLDLAVSDPTTQARVRNFAIVHEKRLHLFVLGRDLGYFAHVHPEQRADGRFSLQHPLPPGEYMLIADFLPEGGTSQMVQKAIIAGGPAPRPLTRDESNGLRVRLETEALLAGKHSRLTFSVEEAATDRPVTDLEPYLGAPAHMLMVKSDLSDAVHAHPEERDTPGPTISFHPILPAAGRYRIWIQFQRRGLVSTHAFDLTVAR